MITRTNMTLHSQFLEEDGVFIWAEEADGHLLPPSSWKHHVFMWHDASCYGSFVEEVEQNNMQGVLLPPHLAFDFFGTAPENKLVHIHWGKDADYYRYTLAPLIEEYREGNVIPSMSDWINDTMSWRIMDYDIDDPLLQRWLSYAVEHACKEDYIHTEKWERIKHLHTYTSYAKAQLQTAVDEEDWLTKIGLLEDDTPFTFSLSLDEPLENSNYWRLTPFLHDKRKRNYSYAYDERKKLPKRWEEYHDRIMRTFEGWGNIAPWLIENGTCKHEITEQEAWTFLTETSEKLLDAGIDIHLPSWWQALKQSRLSLKAKVASTGRAPSFVGMNTLVQFNWRISTQDIELSEDDFHQLVDENRRLLNIRGRWIKLDPAFIQQVKTMMDKANKEGLHFKDILEQEFAKKEQEEGVETPVIIELDDYYSKLMKRLTEISEVPPVQIPESLQATLRPYQQKGIEWMLHLKQLGFGALLADDMGLGKTLQTISYFLYAKENGLLDGPSLIICPTSVLGNWQKEMERFAPSLNVHLHYGANRAKGDDFPGSIKQTDIILTSYALAQLDQEEFQSYTWNTICLDEAQNIKNADTKQSKAIRSFHAHHKIALTGTPMENRLSELWAIFDFLNPGYLGSLPAFSRRFVSPIEKDRDQETIEQLQRFIQPFLLRRTKLDEDVALNLPSKQEQKEYCALTVEQASLYEQLVRDTVEKVETLSGIERRGYILMMLNKLKQICNHPALYLKEEEPQDVISRSNKMETVLELITNIQERNESCLIFTQYIQMGEILQTLLSEQTGQEVLFLNGSVRKQERDSMIERLQSNDIKILILSLKAGGTGLNLTAANHVIHFDRWWNPAVENQATDRAYRIGQTQFVHVHKLITTGTLEEKIDDMLEKKQALNNAIITSEQWITELSTQELKELLGG
ncbi:DEAD/DEAH box helicase [Priestia taiwanensis]|uniref:ATP-dependent helicase n=1 Tax=Priestia taiwanensis TaxID=1347902 RepID=A0A917AXW2_9BACI|nr:DEAD/DEAH box helicase [Priestia taiwanensis]MBM7364357.1 SNF2 family DNA or RNA helicase [Priestia taiwanensis]GGE85073.1 ATP-dependent helicase [Priestia taiwanensis]